MRPFFAVLLTILVWFYALPAEAAELERVPLTLELLQERLRSPMPSEGTRMVDLRRMTIDLRPENAGFRDQFYGLVQAQLQRPGVPVGLDLSNSQIEGDFTTSKLGLRAPIYDGEALSKLFTPTEQEQLRRDRRRLYRLSTLSQSLLVAPKETGITTSLQLTVFRAPIKLVQTRITGFADLTNTFFLNRVEAQGALFPSGADFSQSRFSLPMNFAGANFGREVQFRNIIFFAKAEFNQVQFRGEVNFQGAEFQTTANFNQAVFYQPTNFTRVQWQGNADFAQTRWREQAIFSKAKFSRSLFLTDATFEKAAVFREAQFNSLANLRGATILDRADFSYCSFAKSAYLNVAGLRFDSDKAKILGDPGQIGRVISVPTLQGNENLLRELVRNFRRLEQISDANQIDYTTQLLRSRQLKRQFFGTDLNSASVTQLKQIGFSETQANAIIRHRIEQPFRNLTELLTLDQIGIATYINVRDRVIAADPLPPAFNLWWRFSIGFRWICLSLLLLLSRDGTSFWLSFGIGIVTVAYFSVLFWLVDRARRRYPKPILPTASETISTLSFAIVLFLLGLTAVIQTADRPFITLLCWAIVVIPVPLSLTVWLYLRGRYHGLMEVSYFLEEGTLRQLRILVGRLPTIPRYPLFRERYLPILWNKQWSWLNYFDFSLNNFLRFGFNDIRLRDEHLPGLVSILVWYQWTLGTLYIALLLWTLSRTIPGLNLLIYFK
ncbi:pentapeptide repeat-containing protein [Leptolyngbya sp. FACHB-17]|uniref:pentapeptide repeat-containing protein n=1 Tax=unclassified Leptolyngbya TaxID=2650499 RepID=UPI00167FF85E|nr:pentapeptide repeat-containing protein [Leptolyngbya sp. FACHB-17]